MNTDNPLGQRQMSFLDEPEFDTKHGRAFRRFHRENPHVYTSLLGMIRTARRQGRPRIGMGMLFEALRWSQIETGTEEYKLNNNYRAYYTRFISLTHPDLGEILTRRESMADDDRFEECAA